MQFYCFVARFLHPENGVPGAIKVLILMINGCDGVLSGLEQGV